MIFPIFGSYSIYNKWLDDAGYRANKTPASKSLLTCKNGESWKIYFTIFRTHFVVEYDAFYHLERKQELIEFVKENKGKIKIQKSDGFMALIHPRAVIISLNKEASLIFRLMFTS